MVSKLDLQTYMSEFESHWLSHSYGLVPHLSKKLCKLMLVLASYSYAVRLIFGQILLGKA